MKQLLPVLLTALILATRAVAAPPERWALEISTQDFLSATRYVLQVNADTFTTSQRHDMRQVLERVAYWEEALANQDASVWAVLAPGQRESVVSAIRRLRETAEWKAGLRHPAPYYIDRFLQVAERRLRTRRPAHPPLLRPHGRPSELQPLTGPGGQPYEVAYVLPDLVEEGSVRFTRPQWQALLSQYASVLRTEKVLYGEYVRLSRLPTIRQARLLQETAARLGPAHNDVYRWVLDVLAALRNLERRGRR